MAKRIEVLPQNLGIILCILHRHFALITGLIWGQETVHEKSNEITAIPNLIDLLDVTN